MKADLLGASGIELNSVLDEEDDSLLFAEEDDVLPTGGEAWKIMIVDDEPDVHDVTKLVLREFTFLGKNLDFISAYSGDEAKRLIAEHPDTAIMLLDVIMETESIGLEVVRYIREILGNSLLRIILRTGQPGQVPPKSAILDYDINDYKTKADLTDDKLFVTLVTALRVYDNLQQLEQAKSELAGYSHNLELKVEERTKELQSALTEVDSAHKQILAQEKLAYLGILTAGVAHEIRNPLNFVNNLARTTGDLVDELTQELEVANPERETIKEILSLMATNLSDIKTYGSRADSIICNMLAHANHKGGLKKQLCDLNAVVDEAVRLVYHSAKSRAKGFNAAIKADYDSAIGQISIIPQDLSRALINILDNACYALQSKQMSSGSDYSPTLKIRTRKIGGQVEITIWDNGCGIPSSVVNKIFTPFFTTKSAEQGTGLGLSLTNEIIAGKHQGSIQVNTREGEFTEFQIQLPIA